MQWDYRWERPKVRVYTMLSSLRKCVCNMVHDCQRKITKFRDPVIYSLKILEEAYEIHV